jgi:hypothetical protein
VTWSCGGSKLCCSRILREARSAPCELRALIEEILRSYGPQLWTYLHLQTKRGTTDRRLLRDPDVRRYVCRWNCDEVLSWLFVEARRRGGVLPEVRLADRRRKRHQACLSGRKVVSRKLLEFTAGLVRKGVSDTQAHWRWLGGTVLPPTSARDAEFVGRVVGVLGDMNFDDLYQKCWLFHAAAAARIPRYADHLLARFPHLVGHPDLPRDAEDRRLRLATDGRVWRGAMRRALRNVRAGVPCRVPPMPPADRMRVFGADVLRAARSLPFGPRRRRPPQVVDTSAIMQAYRDEYRNPDRPSPRSCSEFARILADKLRPAPDDDGVVGSAKPPAQREDPEQAMRIRLYRLLRRHHLRATPRQLRGTGLHRQLDKLDVYGSSTK